MAITHIHVRDARDRLIDLLGIGQTYPLRDLAVRETGADGLYPTGILSLLGHECHTAGDEHAWQVVHGGQSHHHRG